MNDDDETVTRMASAHIDSNDRAVLAMLASLVNEADPVPDGLIERSLFALELDELDAHLLELVYDSLTATALAGVRDGGSTESRTLVFEGDGIGVEVEVSDTGVEGQLVPGRPGMVTMQARDSTTHRALADAFGYFRLDARPRGEVRLTCTNADEPFVTPWFEPSPPSV